MPTVTLQDFACSFGVKTRDISVQCRDLINQTDFTYRIIEGEERAELILSILKRIDADKQKIGAEERHEIWDKGWAENLKAFMENQHDLASLIPKFIRTNQPIRFNGQYIMPSNPNFEHDFFRVFRTWLFEHYFADDSLHAIYDFGCGTGFNLVPLAKMYPNKKLHGLDFVSSACNLINKIAGVYKWNIQGHLFDMVNPDDNLHLEAGAVAFTSGSIEQVAGHFEAFLQYLIRNKPALCVHIEPTLELYNDNNLLDYLAIQFHTKRGYTQGFLPRLQELEAEGVIEILKVKRLFFGGLMMEGFNLIIWRPI
jgi:hypothetical protein